MSATCYPTSPDPLFDRQGRGRLVELRPHRVKQQLLALTDEGLAFAEQALARNDQDANVHKWWVGCMYSRTWWW